MSEETLALQRETNDLLRRLVEKPLSGGGGAVEGVLLSAVINRPAHGLTEEKPG